MDAVENYSNRIRFLAKFGLTRFVPLFVVLYIPMYIFITIVHPLLAVVLSHFLLGSFVTWILFKDHERFSDVGNPKLVFVAFGYWMFFIMFNIAVFVAYGVLKMWDQV